MKENRFGFQYSWSDTKPVWALMRCVIAAQVIGAGLGLALAPWGWFDSLWFGCAIATLPGYLVGLVVQRSINPSSLGDNNVLVRRMGLISALLTLGACIVLLDLSLPAA